MIVKKYLLLIMFFSFGNSYAERIIWPITKNAKGVIQLVGEISGEIDLKGTMIFPVKKDGNLFDEKLFNKLNQYYKLIQQGKLKDVAALYSDMDGSKQRYFDGISKAPDKYKGYRDLSDVLAHAIVNWGPYKLVLVSLSTHGGKKMEWREALLCHSTCTMSNAFNHIDETRKLFAAINGKMLRAVYNTDIKGLAKQAEASNLISKDNIAFVLPNWLNSGNSSNINPVLLYPRINRIKPFNLLFTDKPNKIPKNLDSKIKETLDDFVFFNYDLKKLNDELAGENFYEDTASKKLEKIYKKYWDQYKSTETLKIFFREESVSKNRFVLLKSESYSVVAYASHLLGWDGIEIIGYYQSEKSAFIYFFPIDSAMKRIAGSGLQVLPLKSRGNRLVLSLKPAEVQESIIMQSPQMLSGVLNNL